MARKPRLGHPPFRPGPVERGGPRAHHKRSWDSASGWERRRYGGDDAAIVGGTAGGVARVAAAGGAGPAAVAASVLVVGADRVLEALVGRALALGAYRSAFATTADEAVAAIFTTRPDLLVILGTEDGAQAISVCRSVHAIEEIPTIIVASEADTLERVRGLTCADDYITLPVSLQEVAARVGAVLRRALPCRAAARALFDDGQLRIDLRNRLVTVGGGPVNLTPTEYRLLALLASGAGRIFTHDQILMRVWGSSFAGDSHLLRLQVANLRRRIDAPGGASHIETHRGVGYSFRTAPPR